MLDARGGEGPACGRGCGLISRRLRRFVAVKTGGAPLESACSVYLLSAAAAAGPLAPPLKCAAAVHSEAFVPRKCSAAVLSAGAPVPRKFAATVLSARALCCVVGGSNASQVCWGSFLVAAASGTGRETGSLAFVGPAAALASRGPQVLPSGPRSASLAVGRYTPAAAAKAAFAPRVHLHLVFVRADGRRRSHAKRDGVLRYASGCVGGGCAGAARAAPPQGLALTLASGIGFDAGVGGGGSGASVDASGSRRQALRRAPAASGAVRTHGL